MKYCKKCKHLHNDNEELCTACKKPLYEITDENTPVYLISAGGFELQRIKTALEDSAIPCDSIPQKYTTSAEAVTGYDISYRDIVVPYAAYEKAYDVCVGIGAIKEGEEEILEDDGIPVNSDTKTAIEEFEEMSGTKRTTVRVISAILLILIFAAVIYGTDFITGFIKGLFS